MSLKEPKYGFRIYYGDEIGQIDDESLLDLWGVGRRDLLKPVRRFVIQTRTVEV